MLASASSSPAPPTGAPMWRVTLGNLAAGAVSGCAVEAALYPIDTIKTRLQVGLGMLVASGGRWQVSRGVTCGLRRVGQASHGIACALGRCSGRSWHLWAGKSVAGGSGRVSRSYRGGPTYFTYWLGEGYFCRCAHASKHPPQMFTIEESDVKKCWFGVMPSTPPSII